MLSGCLAVLFLICVANRKSKKKYASKPLQGDHGDEPENDMDNHECLDARDSNA